MKLLKSFNIMMILLGSIILVSAQGSNLRQIFDYIILNMEPVASSELKEKGLPKDFYSAKKAFDGKIETAWVEGVDGDGTNEYIMFDLLFRGPYQTYDEFKDKDVKVEITIVNGVAKNKKIWEMNNRIKKAELEVYEAPITIRQIDPWIISEQEPILNTTFTLTLKDDIKPQKFLLKIRLKKLGITENKNSFFTCIGKLIIKEVYPGTTYKDTGISEIDINRIDDD